METELEANTLMVETATFDQLKQEYGASEADDQADTVYYLRHPILFQNAVDDDETNGLGPLPDFESLTINSVTSQYPTGQGIYPIDGKNFDKLAEREVIMTDGGPDALHQKYRIMNISKTVGSENTVTIDLRHIDGDLADLTIDDNIQLQGASAIEAFNAIDQHLTAANPGIRFDSDVSSLSDVNFSMDTPAGNLLTDPDAEGDSATQSILGLFGGELVFDNWQIHHYQQAGRDINKPLKVGRDIQSLSSTTNVESTYTAIYPYATYESAPPQATEDNVDWGSYATNWDSVGTVVYHGGGGLPIYDSPVTGQHQIGTVENGQKIKLGTVVHDGDSTPVDADGNIGKVITTVGGHDWYPIEGGGWIDAQWIHFDKTGDYIVNPASGHVTVDASGTKTAGTKYPASGRAVVTYYGNGDKIHVYYSPYQGGDHYRTGKTLKNGQKFTYDYIACDENGNLWYRIGSHEWIYGPHISLNKSSSYASYPSHGRGVMKKNQQQYVMNKKTGRIEPSKKQIKWVSTRTKRTPKYLKRRRNGKTYKILNPRYKEYRKKKVRTTVKRGVYNLNYGQIVQGGVTYYKTSSGVYAKSSSFDWKADQSVKPYGPSKILAQTADMKGKVEVYSAPTKGSAVNWALKDGTGVDVVSTAKGADGKEWYYVKYDGDKYGYIPAKLTNTKGDIDEEPHSAEADSDTDDDSSSTGQDAQTIKVTLPEKILIADNCIGIENQRVLNLDLSSFFKHDYNDTSGLQADGTWQMTDEDVSQLRELANDAMIEHQIGLPPTSIQVTAEQMKGDLDFLNQVCLNDRIGIEDDNAGVHTTAEVTSTEWDALNHRYISINIGDIPKTWQHLLKEQTQQEVRQATKSTNERIKHTNTLIGRAEYALSLEGDARRAALVAMMKGLDLTDKNGKPMISIKRFNKYLTDWSSKVLKLQNWVDGTKDAVIRGVNADGKIDWENAVDLVAKDEDSEMHFNVKGLSYRDPKTQEIRTAMGSDGSFYAEHGIFGDIIALKGKMVQMDAALRCDVGGFEMTIGQQNKYINSDWNAEKGFAIGSKHYAMGLSSGQLFISGINDSGDTVWTGNYGPSYVDLQGQNGGTIEISANSGTITINGDRVATENELRIISGNLTILQNQVNNLMAGKK